MDIDFNLDNYSYPEILNIFKLNNTNLNEQDLINVENKCIYVKNNSSEDVYLFFMKIYKIIECIHYLQQNNYIYKNDEEKINNYYNKIKKINSFEKIDKLKIINNIKEQVTNLPDSYNDNILIKNNNLNNTNQIVYETKTNVINNTFPNSVAPGDLNSLKRITLFQNLNLNSCFRNNYYTSSSTDFSYIIPTEIKNVVSMRLASIEIPNTWYLFSNKQKNNTFQIIIHDECGTETYIIVIPDGNYDYESLQHYLNTTYFYESNLETKLKYIKFSIDSKNFKTRFEIIEDVLECHDFHYSLIFLENVNDNLMSTAGWLFGFRLPKYLNITGNLQSEGLFDGSGDKYIYLCLNDYQYNTNITNIIGFDKSIMNENILAKIPIVNGKLSIVIDDNNNPLIKTRKYNGPVNINKIHLKIFDKFGNIIDLNNMDFSFTLELEVLYECFNFKNIIH